MLARILEPEVMDTADDAREYDTMDHAAVNTVFVNDLLTALTDWSHQRPVEAPLSILDLGAGTVQIPIELSRRAPHIRVTAVDAAESMLGLAHQNLAAANLANRITLIHADAKQLPFADGAFQVVISNSIVHHIPEPRAVFSEAVRVTAPAGLMFHRDLARPQDEPTLQQLVNTYAAEANSYQRRLFAESLHAALAVEEVAKLVSDFGFDPATVQMTSDRHWTWCATNPASP
jgi:ubiquinone/menaquinone biosynthesis C-methylase UbiE